MSAARTSAADRQGGRTGRPLLHRVTYARDLAHLERLRRAALGDIRISGAAYGRLADHVRAIEAILRGVPRKGG